ncbi:hypothetical protein C8A05DRAFT_12590 [Staphylotrichum tortipilum]|uniref:AT hook domain-containing protein n=1 Tax=Staphylotrichum tortipilum TaxID=2831512 RepID=A0AAN6MS54_9PEZI|nr:hypothetical protein C8A05DRAFT_12590 [Staphylotrichum longicolle]
MGPRREILDSEDDGSDFGDEAGFGDAAAPELGEEVPHEIEKGMVGASSSTGATDSTDPSFFQHVYDQQQAAAAADTQDIIPDTAPPAGPGPGPGPSASAWTEVSSAPPPGQKPQTGNFSSLTSITDPVPASMEPKRTRGIPQSEVIDLTDVPSPPKPAASPAVDPWDVPPSSSSQLATRTHGKRNIAPLSLEQEPVSNTMPPTQDPYAFPESTPPVRKKANRRETPSLPPQKAQAFSPVMLIPTEEAASPDPPTRSSRKKKGSSSVMMESSMPDTAAPSLYIAQSTLTTSQKQEYQVVSLSSEAGPEFSEMLPPEQPFRAGETYRSSGATTIAYPTPSRVVSSRRLPDIEEDGYGAGLVETSLPQETHYQSSPDVLGDMTSTTASTSKRSRAKVVSTAGLTSSEADPPASTRRAKKRKIVREVEDDSWEMGSLGAPQEDANHTNFGGEPDDALSPTMQPEAGMDVQSLIPEPEAVNPEVAEPPASTAKGKKGRKKKAPKPKATISDTRVRTPPAEASPEPDITPIETLEPPPATAKRKRGRPSKAKAAQPVPEAEEPQQPAEQAELDGADNTVPHPLSQALPNSRPEDEVETTTGLDEHSEENTTPEVAVEEEAKVKDKIKDKEKGKQATKDAKAAGGLQKVQYRVGLSKRSRIAPLLKSLKKPV